MPQRTQLYLPFGFYHLTRLLSLLIGFILVYLSFHLYQALLRFEETMTRGVSLVGKRPAVLTLLLFLALADWASTVFALWFCFYTLWHAISIGNLITGFSLGITAGFVSFIPGGLGVQEGSMAGLYALLGEPLETAILAAILFRMIYYFLPFFISLGFYRRLLQAD